MKKQQFYAHMLLLGVAGLISGCGTGTIAHSPGVVSSAPASLHPFNVTGTIHGGPNPIQGATVTLYETQVSSTSTYGAAGKVLDTTTTDGNGNFQFDNTGANAYTCDTSPYMQYAYMTVTGGNTGGNTVNNNSVLMAAVGACSNLLAESDQDATFVWINEASTVAAAYALGNFMTVSGTAGSQVVSIGSPAENDATVPACTGVGSAMSCVAGGLGHAFANAAEVENAVTFANSGIPTGQFNTTVASFPGSVIPQAMLNVVADALLSCVNSSGGTTGSCSTLFTDTTPSGGSAPTNTLSAAMNIVKNPALNTIAGSGGIFSLVTSSSFFQPTIGAAPTDYTLAVVFPGGASYPNAWSLATDISDNVYILAADGNKTSTVTVSGVAAIGYNASNQTSVTYGYSTNSGSDASHSYLVPGSITVDGVGNIFVSNAGPDAATNRFREFNAESGAFTTSFTPAVGAAAVLYPDQMAADRSNNLWAVTLSQASNPSAIYQIPTTGTITNYSASNTSGGFRGVAVDSNQNVWSCPAGKGGANLSQFAVFPNTGGIAGSTLYTGSISGSAFNPLGEYIALDSSNAAYCATGNGALFAKAVAPVDSSNVVNGAPIVSKVLASPVTTGNNVGAEVDGDGTYFMVQGTATGNLLAVTSSGTGGSFAVSDYSLAPCYPVNVSGTSYCSYDSHVTSHYYVTAFPTALQIDSTGSIWISSGTASAYSTGYTTSTSNVVQIIGLAAPVWPQLSYGYPGTRPAPITTGTPQTSYQTASKQVVDQLLSGFYLPSSGLFAEDFDTTISKKGSTSYLFTADYILRMLYWSARVDPQYASNLSDYVAATTWYKSGPGYGVLKNGQRFFDDNALFGGTLMDIYLNVLPQQSSVLSESLTALNYVYSNTDAQGGIPQTEASLGQGNFYLGPIMQMARTFEKYGNSIGSTSYQTIGHNYWQEINDPALGLIKPNGLFTGGTVYDSTSGTWTPSTAGAHGGDSSQAILLAIALYQETGDTSYVTYAENLMNALLTKFYTPGGGLDEVATLGSFGIMDALCSLYLTDHNVTWYNDAKDITDFLLNDARDTAGYFPSTSQPTGKWNIVRTGDAPDANVTLITQAAAAAAIMEFAYTDLHK